MVELQLSLRCSEYFAATARFKVQAGVITSLFLILRLVRLVLMHAHWNANPEVDHEPDRPRGRSTKGELHILTLYPDAPSRRFVLTARLADSDRRLGIPYQQSIKAWRTDIVRRHDYRGSFPQRRRGKDHDRHSSGGLFSEPRARDSEQSWSACRWGWGFHAARNDEPWAMTTPA
jgi:hypothetical protein